jgi:hypothetical protein
VGSCCVKRFEKKRLCRTCRNPHSGTKYNQSLTCRNNEEARKKQEHTKEKQQQFHDFWRNATVREKLRAHELTKLQRLAENKGIMKVQRYDRDALIDELCRFTTHRDFPIR